MKLVLVVDDSREICDFLADLCRFYEFAVVTAASGEEALPLVRHRSIDFAFIDICLPGMSGIEVLREIRNIHPSAKCALMSGFPTDEYVQQGLALGAACFLQKPFPIETVIAMLRSD